VGTSTDGGRCDREPDRAGAGVKALVPHRDREICRAECKRTEPIDSPSAHMFGFEGLRSAARSAMHDFNVHDKCMHDTPLADRP
jgi:hypothetical protein